MSLDDRDPYKVAAAYRVAEPEFRANGVYVHLVLRPQRLFWISKQETIPGFTVDAVVSNLQIGHHSHEEPSDSSLVENCIFVFDGNEVRYLPLNEVRITTDKHYFEYWKNISLTRGLEVSDDIEDNQIAVGSISHVGAMPETGIEESLECGIGLTEENFGRLVDGCQKRSISNVYLHAMCIGRSTSPDFGVARDLILRPDEKIAMHIDSFSITYRID